MKKIEYQAPELEIVKIDGPVCLVSASDGSGSVVTPPTEDSDEPNLE